MGMHGIRSPVHGKSPAASSAAPPRAACTAQRRHNRHDTKGIHLRKAAARSNRRCRHRLRPCARGPGRPQTVHSSPRLRSRTYLGPRRTHRVGRQPSAVAAAVSTGLSAVDRAVTGLRQPPPIGRRPSSATWNRVSCRARRGFRVVGEASTAISSPGGAIVADTGRFHLRRRYRRRGTTRRHNFQQK